MSINSSVKSNYNVDLRGLSTAKNTKTLNIQPEIKTNILDDINSKTTNAKTETIDLNVSSTKVTKPSTTQSNVNKLSPTNTNVNKYNVNSQTNKTTGTNNVNSNINSNTINYNSSGKSSPASVNSDINQNINIDSNKNTTSMPYNKILEQENSKKNIQNNTVVTSGGTNMSSSNFSFSNSSFDGQASTLGNSGNINGNLNASSSNRTISKGKTVGVGEITRITNYVQEVDINQFVDLLQKMGIQDKDIKRIIDQQITLEDLIKEIENDKDNSRRKAIMEASYLQAYGLNVESLSKLLELIKTNQTELQKLINMRDLSDTHEMEALLKIVSRLKLGENLNNILSTEIVAWKYQDENGNTRYVYKQPNIDGDIKYTPLTYEEMYKDSKYIEKLKELTKITSKSMFTGKETTVYMWNNTSEQMKFFDELTNKYNEEVKTREENLKRIDKQIETLKQNIANYQSIYENANREINHYFKNIDSYVHEKGYEQNNKFSKNSLKTIEKIEKLYEQGKIPGTNNGSPIYVVKNEEELVDIINCIINGKIKIDEYGFVQTDKGNFQIQADDMKLDHYLKWANFMDGNGRQEKEVFNFIYNTKGSKEAYKYLDSISDELDNRWLIDKTMKDEEFAKEHKILASASSIVTGPLEGISAACYSLNYLMRDEKIRRTNVYSSSDIYRQAISADIAEDNEALAFAYSTMMSMADSATLIALSAATGGTAAPILSGTLMGSRAYVTTLNDALDRGVPDWKAVLLAGSAGVTESFMENYSVSHLLNLESKASPAVIDMANKISDAIPNKTLANIATRSFYGGAMTLSQALVEGEEELSTDITNFIFDEFISGDLSGHTQAISNYVDQGYSEDVARQMANKDFVNQLGQTFLGGFVSGIGFGGFGSVSTNHKVTKQITNNMLNDYYSNLNLNEAQKFARQLKLNQLQYEMSLAEEKSIKQAKRQENIKKLRDIVDKININSAKPVSNVNASGSLNTGVPISVSEITDFKKAAHDFAEGNEKLEKLLLECFDGKIETKASCAGHENRGGPYLAFVDNQKNMDLIPSIVEALGKQSFNIVYQNATASNGNEGYIGYDGEDVSKANDFFDAISKGIKTETKEDIPKIIGNYISLINTIKNDSNFEHAQIVCNKDGDEYYIEANIKTLAEYKDIFIKNGFKVNKDNLLVLEGNNNYINTNLTNLLTDLGGISTYDFSNLLDLSDFKYQDNNLITGFINTFKSGVKRFVYTNTNNVEGVNKSILDNGLYHFTKEESADKIIKSGYIKKANAMTSYGTPKSFFFNGVPSVGAYLTNLDSLPIRTTAVKVNVDEQLVNNNKLKIRNLDDKAITYEGNLDITNYNPEKKYFCLVKEGNELVYKEVDKNTYDNYPNTSEGMKLQKFTKKIGNLKAIYNDYLYNIAANNKVLSKEDITTLKNYVPKANVNTNVFENNNPIDVDIMDDISLDSEQLKQYEILHSQFDSMSENYSKMGNSLRSLKSLSQAVLMEDGTYKIYPVESDVYIDKLTKYCVKNNFTFNHDLVKISEAIQTMQEKIYDQLKTNQVRPYYGNQEFLTDRINAIMTGLTDMYNSSYFTNEEHETIEKYFNEANQNINSIKDFLSSNKLTYQEYENLEKCYLELEKTEKTLGKINERKWKQFFKDNNAKFVHVLSSGAVNVDEMKKVCATLVTDNVMPLATYGNIGYEFDFDMDYILSLCPEDSGSWKLNEDDFISSNGIITGWQNTGSGYFFEYGKFSNLFSPEYVENYSISSNLKLNGEILNYNNHSAYSEIFLTNFDKTLKATKAFYTDDATPQEIEEIKKIAALQGLEVEKLSLDEARAKKNLPPLYIEEALSEYDDILSKYPELANFIDKMEKNEPYQIPSNLQDSFDRVVELQSKIQEYFSSNNATNNQVVSNINEQNDTLESNIEGDDVTAPLIPIERLVDILKNDDLYNSFQTNNKIDNLSKDEYLQAFMKFHDAILKNEYDLNLNKEQLQRLEDCYKEAIKTLEISEISYSEDLPDSVKLKLMFENNQIYNINDLDILYDYYFKNYNDENLSNDISLILSKETNFYFNTVRSYVFKNLETLETSGIKYNYFWNLLTRDQINCINTIIENKIDVGQDNFRNIVYYASKINWNQELRDYVNYFKGKYTLDISKFTYDNDMPDDLKLKLMLKDKVIYDKDLMIKEMNNLITEQNLNDPNFIFNDLFILYYTQVSKNLTLEESQSCLSYEDCNKIYLDDIKSIIENNIEVSEQNFIKLQYYVNLNNPSVKNYMKNYLENHNIDASNLIYSVDMPKFARDKIYDRILENYDNFIKESGTKMYGADQNIASKYVQLTMKSLDWLDENDFKAYLINKRGFSKAEANIELQKLKALKLGNLVFDNIRIFDANKGSIYIEYIIDKYDSKNQKIKAFDFINENFELRYNYEVRRLADSLVSKGMTDMEALRTLIAVDSTGVCSYAAVANVIFTSYKNNPGAFARDFGFPMYVTVNGNKELNSAELILDMYTYANSNKYNPNNEKNMFYYDNYGKLHVNNLATNNQVYLSHFSKLNYSAVNSYLQSKKSSLKYSEVYSDFCYQNNKSTKEKVKEFREIFTNYLNNNENNSVLLTVKRTNRKGILKGKCIPLRFMSNPVMLYFTTSLWDENTSHIVYVTGMTDRYVIISSWGMRFLIPIGDFVGNDFAFQCVKLEGIE